MPSATELAEDLRVEQAQIAASTTKEALTVWLAVYRPGESQSWGMLIRLLWSLLLRSRNRSATSAVGYYLKARDAAGVPSVFEPTPAPDPPARLLQATAGITGDRAYARSLSAGMSEDAAKRNAGVILSGSVSRLALDAGRETILSAVRDDDDAIGWARVTDANPCAFCSMLASRGPSFLSKETASFQAHAHCACVAAAVFNRDEAWLGHSKDLYAQWKRVTAGHSGKDALREWRRYWRTREA